MTNHSASEGTPTVTRGQQVLTLDNDRLGEVSETSGDYFTVERGLFRSDLYISFEDINNIRPDTVVVNATTDEVDIKNWQEPPLNRGHQGEGPTRP